ncbi:phage tail fiber protein [Pseudomonas aeruginosa]|uniref:phage tail fiber domain-containing protein n=1 Tax=Pseudomonas aeruginosa TaxID=287 RepID=UPI003F81E99A
MTVPTNTSVVEYEGNGVTTAFPVPFKFPANDDLVVTKVYNDVANVLVLGTDYTVVGAGAQSGGAVIATSAPEDGAIINISRELDAVQETDLRNQGRYFAETHESVFDYLTMLIQQCFSGLSRALKRPVGKDYYDAENRRISRVADPVENKDAANKEWTEQYVGSVIGSGTGPINLASNVIYIDPKGVPRTVQDMSSTTNPGLGASMIGWKREEINEIKTTGDMLSAQSVNVLEFANLVTVKPDPDDVSTWDWTPAVQAAVNDCNASFPAKELVVPTMIRLASTVNIDRPVYGETRDNYRDTFLIRGVNGGGFITTSSIAMFGSSIAQNIDATGALMPCSRNIKFQNLTLTSSDSSLLSFVLDGNKLMSVFVEGCAISKIKLVRTSSYLQSIYFGPNNNVRGWQGTFLEADGGSYDVRAHSCQIEHGGNFWLTIDNTNNKSVTCCGVDDCLVEGLSGFAILYSHVRGFYVSNCYFEWNSGPDVIGDSFPEKANAGVVHIGNFHSVLPANKLDPAFWPVRWGYTFGGTSLSNFCDFRLNFVRSDTQVTMNDAAQDGASNSDNKLILNDISLGTVRPSDDPPAYGSRFWRAGSVVINRDHGTKGYAGWICATSGNPGVWYPFGTTCDGAAWNFTNINGDRLVARISVADPASGKTTLFLRYNNGTDIQLGEVSIGAANSGGLGFRTLLIPN